MHVKQIYSNQEKRVCDVEILGEIFEGIEYNTEKCRECEDYNGYRDVCILHGSIFKCPKKEEMYQKNYIFVTSIIVLFTTILIFTMLKFAFWTKVGILILCLVALDIMCSLIEKHTPKVYEKQLYNKFKKAQKKEKELEAARIKAEETKKQLEEEEKMAKNPQYKNVKNAEEVVERLKTISEQYDFGKSEKKIDICVEKSEAILERLRENPSAYIRISQLFELYLPEFCDTLNYYTDFIKADVVAKEHERTLIECVDTILQYLEGQRVKAIFDKDFVETQFQSSANTLKKVLKEENDK